MSNKRQQTFAKMTRERLVRERRELKQEKKRAAAAERKAIADGTYVPTEDADSTPESAEDEDSTLESA